MGRRILISGIICLMSVSLLMAQQSKKWTLEECIAYALEQNIQIRKSGFDNKRHELYYEQAKAQRFPSANAAISQNFGWDRNTTVSNSDLTGSSQSNYSLSTGITIFNASKLTNQIRQAELDITGGEFSLETTRESVSLSILDAFLQIIYAEEQVRNSEKQIGSTTGQLNLAAERLALKIISQADYAQIKSELTSEKLTLASSESQLAMAKLNLMQLMELPVCEHFEIKNPEIGDSINQNRIPDIKAVYETALAIKPQIKNAVVNKEIAALDEQIAKAGYYPSLSASAGISTGYIYNYDFLVDNEPYFNQLNNAIHPTAGLSLSVPLYQRKQVKTSVAVAEIGYKDAELAEIETKNQLRKNIEQACLDVTSAQFEYEASLEKYKATLESSRLSDEKFIQGLINSVDYLVSKTNLITAESQLLKSKYNLIFSYKILDFYSGIPLSL